MSAAVTYKYIKETPKCIVCLDDQGKTKWLTKKDNITHDGNIVTVVEVVSEIVKTGSYFEDLVLHDEELYDKVLVEIDLKAMKRILAKDKNFVRQLAASLFDAKEEKRLRAWYNTKIIHMGTNGDSMSVLVDGEVVHKV